MSNNRPAICRFTLLFNEFSSLTHCFHELMRRGYKSKVCDLKDNAIFYDVPHRSDSISLFESHVAQLEIQPLSVLQATVVFADVGLIEVPSSTFKMHCVGRAKIEGEIANDPKSVRLLEKALALLSEKNREATIGDLLCILAEKQKAGAKWHRLVWCGAKEVLYMVIAFTCAAFMDSIVAWFKGWIAKLF